MRCYYLLIYQLPYYCCLLLDAYAKALSMLEGAHLILHRTNKHIVIDKKIFAENSYHSQTQLLILDFQLELFL